MFATNHLERLHRVVSASVRSAVLAAIVATATSSVAHAEPITYQGVLTSLGEPVFGPIDVRATLFDAEIDGMQVGPTVHQNVGADLTGTFTVDLDFGPEAFLAGQPRWVQIEIAYPAGSGDYTLLNPRQRVNAAPMALGLAGVERILSSPPEIDQSQTSNTVSAVASLNCWQSFTAGVLGDLVGVDLQLQPQASAGDITVTVHAGVGPEGPVLGAGSIPVPTLNPGEFLRQFTVPLPPIPVTPNQAYTQVFTGSSLLGTSTVQIWGAQGRWGGFSANFWFRTRVEPKNRLMVRRPARR